MEEIKKENYQADIINSIINKSGVQKPEKMYDDKAILEIIENNNNKSKKVKLWFALGIGLVVVIISVLLLILPNGSQIVRL